VHDDRAGRRARCHLRLPEQRRRPGPAPHRLPPQINLSDPQLARFYSRVSFTNKSGIRFRGAPIYDSVTVLQRSDAEQTAIDFVRLLLSPLGRRMQQSRGFLDTPVLVGGDSSAVPRKLRRYIDGCYERKRCGHRGHGHAPH
jgi:hypothetical protein